MRLSSVPLPLQRLSATSLSCFITCPEQFRHKYLLHEPERMSGERFMGSVHHQALASLFDEIQVPTDVAVSNAWANVIEREGEPEWHDMDATEAFRRAKLMLETYWPTAEQIKPIAVEQRFEEQIAGITVSGYVDRELNDRILEVKTSDRKQTKPKARWGFQGRLYALVSAKPVEWHVVTRQVTPKVYTAAEEPLLMAENFRHDQTVQIVAQAVHYMSFLFTRYGEARSWPTSGIFGDWTCGYCSYQKVCPAWSSAAPSAAG